MPAKEIVKKAKEVRQQKPSMTDTTGQIKEEEKEIREDIRSVARALTKIATERRITVENIAGQLKDTVNDISRIIDRITARN